MSTLNQENVIDDTVNCIKKSRKRTQNPTKHKIYEQKRKVQAGEEHVKKSGKIIGKKEFRVQITCRCKKKCAERINALRQHKSLNVSMNSKIGQRKHCIYENV